MFSYPFLLLVKLYKLKVLCIYLVQFKFFLHIIDALVIVDRGLLAHECQATQLVTAVGLVWGRNFCEVVSVHVDNVFFVVARVAHAVSPACVDDGVQ